MAKPGSFCSNFPSFAPSSPSLSHSLWGFFSLLDGAEAEPQTNFSHSCNEAWRAQFVSLRGNRIHSSVPQKTPFFQTERELFVWWQLQLSSGSSCDSFKSKSMMACCAHYRHATLSCVAMFVTNNQIVHRVPLNEASKWFQIICVIVKKTNKQTNKQTKHMEELAWFSCAKEMLHNTEATLWC